MRQRGEERRGDETGTRHRAQAKRKKEKRKKEKRKYSTRASGAGTRGTVVGLTVGQVLSTDDVESGLVIEEAGNER